MCAVCVCTGKLLKEHGSPVPTRLWVAPPTKMDEQQLTTEGYYSIYGSAGARTEMPVSLPPTPSHTHALPTAKPPPPPPYARTHGT